ncbi:MAG: sortase [Candidatus Dojkabacteria bacterium]|nr:MAG: sortase [Candidatus Dojkabacteria bacterium]
MEFAVDRKQRTLKDISFILSYVGFLLITAGTILLLIPALPWVYYRINVEATSDEVDTLTGFIGIGAVIGPTPSLTTTPTPIGFTPTPTPTEKPRLALPQFDASLPRENTLKIPKIGVNGILQEGNDSKRALYNGIWRVPEFGTPLRNDSPIILAAHRYGYIEWSSAFRKTNTFANLPNLKEGDTFQLIWEQRAYVYKVYKVEENTQLTDYNADIILYTCKHLKSPVRIVVYAQRIQ